MIEHRIKLGKGGRVVIPACFRHELQVESGDELIFCLEHGELKMKSLKQAVESAQVKVQKYTKGRKVLVNKLMSMRKDETNRS